MGNIYITGKEACGAMVRAWRFAMADSCRVGSNPVWCTFLEI